MSAAQTKRSADPRQLREPPRRGVQNSTWPTLPYGSAVQALLLYFKSPRAQVRGFLESSNLTHARQFKLSVAAWGHGHRQLLLSESLVERTFRCVASRAPTGPRRQCTEHSPRQMVWSTCGVCHRFSHASWTPQRGALHAASRDWQHRRRSVVVRQQR